MLRKIIFYSHISVYVFAFSKHQPIHPEPFRVFTYCLNNNKNGPGYWSGIKERTSELRSCMKVGRGGGP